jgi:hypothetical protein
MFFEWLRLTNVLTLFRPGFENPNSGQVGVENTPTIIKKIRFFPCPLNNFCHLLILFA